MLKIASASFFVNINLVVTPKTNWILAFIILFFNNLC